MGGVVLDFLFEFMRQATIFDNVLSDCLGVPDEALEHQIAVLTEVLGYLLGDLAANVCRIRPRREYEDREKYDVWIVLANPAKVTGELAQSRPRCPIGL